MNALARYLLVFLLGWSGAVWSYSDLIYKKNETPQDIEVPQKTDDTSLTTKGLKLPPTASGRFTQKGTGKAPSTTIPDNKQPLEGQATSQ